MKRTDFSRGWGMQGSVSPATSLDRDGGAFVALWLRGNGSGKMETGSHDWSWNLRPD